MNSLHGTTMYFLVSEYKANEELDVIQEKISMLSVIMIIIRKDSASTRGVSWYIIEAHEILLFSRPVKAFRRRCITCHIQQKLENAHT